MKEIQERLDTLIAAYQRQREIYLSILGSAPLERQHIERGDMTRLLPLLQSKHEQMEAASQEERAIQEVQTELAAIFQLDEFSLSRIRDAAPQWYKPHLDTLAQEISGIVECLETLENQEREFEGKLKVLTEAKQRQRREGDNASKKRASRAYRPKPKT